MFNSINSSFKSKLLIFILSPFIAFLGSVRKLEYNGNLWIVLLFTLYFSFTFIPVPRSDATRYEQRFTSLENYNIERYITDISGMYDGESMYQDAYVYTVQFLISHFTKDIRIYRLFFGFVYFLFFLKFIQYLIRCCINYNSRFNWFILGIVFLISFTAGINGIRWGLGLWVFLTGIIKFIKTERYKYLFLVVISGLIHFSYIYLLIFVIFYVITKKFYSNNRMLQVVIMIFLVMLNSFFGNLIKSNLGIIGSGVEEKAIGYVENENYQTTRLEKFNNNNWYIQLQRTVPVFYVFGIVLFTLVVFRNKSISLFTSGLQYFTLVMYLSSIVSIQFLDSTSNRYTIIAMASGVIYLYFLNNELVKSKLMRLITLTYVPIAVLNILVILRGDLFTVSPNLIFGNIMWELLYTFDESIMTILAF